MKLVLDWIKVVSLVALVGLMALPYLQQKTASIKTTTEIASLEIQNHTDEHETEIIRILERSLRGVFKFPDSVRIAQSKVSQFELLAAAGIKVTNADDKIEIWKVCGTYSAPTPLGLYGPNELFFIDAAVNYLEKEIVGEIYFQTEGEWKQVEVGSHFISSISSKEDLERNRIKYCGDVQRIAMGSLSGFTFGYGRSRAYENVVSDIAKNKENVAELNACLANGDRFDNCLSWLPHH
jgi:hypothetical protein